MKMRGSLSEASPSPWPGTVDFLNLGARVGLSLRGEAGAKRRVRVLSAWRRLWAPSIKILRRSAGKIAPRAKDPHPTLSQLGEGIRMLLSPRNDLSNAKIDSLWSGRGHRIAAR